MTDVVKSLRNPLILIVGLLVAWQLLYWFAGDIAMRAPAATIRYTANLLTTDTFWVHLSESMRAFAAALAIAVALGLLIGFWLGLHRFSGDVLEPTLVALYSIPKITLYPLVLLAFGLGMPAKIAFGAIHGIIPIALFTINALRNIKPILIKAGRVLKLRRARDDPFGPVPGRSPGDLHRLPRWIFADPDWNPAWRDVCSPAWSRLPPDDRNRFAQRRPDHGRDVPSRCLRRCR